MLQRILVIKSMPVKLDATDALAVAICHFFQNRVGGSAQPEKKFNEHLASLLLVKIKIRLAGYRLFHHRYLAFINQFIL